MCFRFAVVTKNSDTRVLMCLTDWLENRVNSFIRDIVYVDWGLNKLTIIIIISRCVYGKRKNVRFEIFVWKKLSRLKRKSSGIYVFSIHSKLRIWATGCSSNVVEQVFFSSVVMWLYCEIFTTVLRDNFFVNSFHNM